MVRAHDSDAPHLDNIAELGAETIQLAIAMPLLLVVAMAIIQLGLMAFATLTLENEGEQAAWAVDLSQLQKAESPQAANELVASEIEKRAIAFDKNSLDIKGASFTSTDTYSIAPIPKAIANRNIICDEENRYQLAQMVRETCAGLVEFDISYELPTLINLPGLSHVRVTKHIARERVLSTRTEIS